MWRISLSTLRHKPGRFIATMLAVLVGTGFLAGALVLRDSLGPALEANEAISLRGVDVVVLPSAGTDENQGRRRAQQLLRTVPGSVLGQVQKATGVAAAVGVNAGQLKLLGPNDSVVISDLGGRNWITTASMNPFTITQGSAPSASGQVAIDTQTASEQNLSVGSPIQLATSTGPREVTVVGLSNFGGRPAANPSGDVLVAPPDVQAFLTSGQDTYDSIEASAKPGTSPESLAQSVSAAVGSGFEVQTAAAYLQAQTDSSASAAFAGIISTGLQAFAYVALFVAAFVIYNTFAIIVAQRVKEFALLRAIGASGKQVKRAVRYEALFVGLVASAAGVVLGVVLFEALIHLVPQAKNLVGGADITLHLQPGAVIQVMVSGVVITLLSAIIPGWRAARTAPVAAMRDVAIDRSGTSRFRMVLGSAFLIGGVGLLVLGAATSKALIVGFGTLVSFMSVLIGGPVLAHYFTKAAGWVTGLFGQAPGRLAVANVERNGNRTATTANALVIGVFLVVFVTSAGAALRDFSVQQLSKFTGADYAVTATGGSTLPAEVIPKVAATPGVTNTAVVYGDFATPVGGFTVGAVDLAKAEQVYGITTVGKPLTQLGPDEVAVVGLGQNGGNGGGRRNADIPTLGSTVSVTFTNGQTRQYKAATSFSLNLGLPFVLMSPEAAKAADPGVQPTSVGVVVAPGEEDSTQQALQKLVAGYSNIEVQPGNLFGQIVKTIFNFLISSVNALLAVAIVIALFGIVNTLILSIVERTREIGVLRAVGMSRGQLRTMVRVEALIVALLGTLVGMAFGVLVAFALVRPLVEQGTGVTWPYRDLAVILVLGVVIGVVASLIPAWRASRLDVLESIRDY